MPRVCWRRGSRHEAASLSDREMFLITLHGFQRSSASFRVRIALNLKRVEYRTVTHDLSLAEHRAPAYLTINPQGCCRPGGREPDPDAIAGHHRVSGGAIPQPPLLPPDPAGAAGARALFQVIAADTHALASMRVGAYLKQRLGHDDAQVRAWQHHWIGQSFDALETCCPAIRRPANSAMATARRWRISRWCRRRTPPAATAWSSGHGRRSPASPTPACACRPSRRPTPIMC